MSAPDIHARFRRSAAIVAAVAALLLTPVLSGPALGQSPADPDDKDPDKGKPESAAVAGPAAPDCDLDLGDHPDDEFAGCTEVVLSFGSTPGVDATTQVDVAVTSVADLDDATLRLLVNDQFELTDAAGFAAAGAEASGVGPMTSVARSVDVAARETARFSFSVRGTGDGIGVVQARLETEPAIFNGGDELSVQLGSKAPLTDAPLATERAPAAAAKAPAGPRTGNGAAAPVKGAKSASPNAPNASCATGRWVFNDENGLQTGSMNFQVQVWDQDTGPDDHLATGVTGSNGNYNICFESTDEEGGGQNVYLRFISSNSAWRVRDTAASNQNYTFSSHVVTIPDPGTANFGTLQPANAALHRALHAFDGINLLWLWHVSIGPYLDNPGQTRQMIVNWTPTSTDGTYYSLGGNDIHLAAADPDADHVTIHEGAHALMDAIYNDDYPPFPNCNPHFIFGASSTGCAWTEGWAEWVPARVLNDPFFRFPNGSAVNLETPTWTTNTSAYGDTVEGRVAGALIDLSDHANETFWDRFGEGGSNAASEEIYATNLIDVSDTFNEYFNIDRPGEGDTGFFARASVFQNTIDYTHRDPLVTQQELTRPSLGQAPNPHNYSYTTTGFRWGGVAIRPPSGADYDLRLYGNQAQTDVLASSTFGGSAIDYVLVDGNHRTGSFFPRAFLFSGNGSYQVEQFSGTTDLNPGAFSSSFVSGDVIRPFDRFASGGVTQFVRVVPSGGLDVELFAHDSDGTSAGAVQSRGQALASSTSAGAGGAEGLNYTVAEGDWTGIVVTNKGGSGSYTLYVDTAGPSSPSVEIDGGNPQTYDTTVDLSLSAVGVNTPVTEMQISTDGVFDSEPWQAYATSATTTLPGGFGTKTVSVRYRNAAGAISSVANDTIDYVVTPTCDGQTATIAGFGVIEGTPGADVIVGGPGDDTINAKGGNDLICGLGGHDTISDGGGADVVRAGPGGDTMIQPASQDAGDVLDGGTGSNDTVSYQSRSGGVTVRLNALADDGAPGEGDLVLDVENATGGAGDDTLVGNAGNNTLDGRGGSDTLDGLDGNDKLNGGVGDDVLRGGDGSDRITGGAGDDTVNEGASANGNDIINGGVGVDRILYSARTSSVTINLNNTVTSGETGENDKLAGFEIATGGTGDDTIQGVGAAETLNGNGGHDTIKGGGGDDVVNGGAGNDTIGGGGGADNLFGGGGDDALNSKDGVGGNDSIDGGPGTDTAVFDPGDIVIGVP